MKREVMSPHPVLCAVLLSACATTGIANDREHTQRARVQLAPMVDDQTVRVMPQALEPELPSADRIARVIQAQLGDEPSVDVRYCVSPQGNVVSAELARSSSLAAFDQAVLNDFASWQFAAQPGPDSMKSCARVTVVYHPNL